MLPFVAETLKKDREERAECERRWAEERKREEEARKRREEYNRKAQAIQKLAQSWHEAKRFRDFAAAIKASSEDPGTLEEQKPELATMTDFALHHANYVDPLTDLKWMIGQFKNPSSQYSY